MTDTTQVYTAAQLMSSVDGRPLAAMVEPQGPLIAVLHNSNCAGAGPRCTCGVGSAQYEQTSPAGITLFWVSSGGRSCARWYGSLELAAEDRGWRRE
jgi:hypothetical protein